MIKKSKKFEEFKNKKFELVGSAQLVKMMSRVGLTRPITTTSLIQGSFRGILVHDFHGILGLYKDKIYLGQEMDHIIQIYWDQSKESFIFLAAKIEQFQDLE